jgi:prepilin-type N-terminal cleavage/methylation domain-containing protein
MSKNKGITLIEILLAISIAAIVTSIGFASFYQWRTNVALINQIDEIKSQIVEVRQLAISAADGKNWGIHLEDENYIVFSGDSYNELDPNNKTASLRSASILNPEASLSDGIGGFSSDLIFTKFTGYTANTGTIELMYNNNPDFTRSITIDDLGKIN